MLENWKNYIDPVELQNLINFIESVKNGEVLTDKFLVINGDYCTGKSTLLNNIINEIGINNTAELYCSSLKNDCFENNKLSNKLVIFDEDNHEDSITSLSSKIKQILSRDISFYKREIYKEKEEFIPTSNVILVTRSLNKLDEALLRRAMVVNLTHKFNT